MQVLKSTIHSLDCSMCFEMCFEMSQEMMLLRPIQRQCAAVSEKRGAAICVLVAVMRCCPATHILTTDTSVTCLEWVEAKQQKITTKRQCCCLNIRQLVLLFNA